MTETVVLRSVTVRAPLEKAFEKFTADFGAVKPPDHNLIGVAAVETTFEPYVGGHIVDRAPDGRECRWARVLVWEPPHRVVFSWDITPQWQLETDPELTSEVEVRFIAEDDGRTRVELEHRNLDRHGPGWDEMSDAVAGPNGWPVYLSRFEALL